MKRASDRQEGDAEGQVPFKRQWNGKREVVPASAHPSLSTVMSMHVQHLCASQPPNATGLWARWNKCCIGGTKVANAIGLNGFPGGDAVTLWNRLCGYEDAETMNDEQQARVAFGIENEARARDLYFQLMGANVTLVGTHDRTISSLYPWIDYGCDGHANGYPSPYTRAGTKKDYLLEIKCPTGKPYESVPLTYMVQIQTGMAVHGMTWCDFIMYTRRTPPGEATDVEHLKVWRVHFSPECWALILDKLLYFLNCLDTEVPPETEYLLRPGLDKHHFEAPAINMTVILDQDVRPQ